MFFTQWLGDESLRPFQLYFITSGQLEGDNASKAVCNGTLFTVEKGFSDNRTWDRYM